MADETMRREYPESNQRYAVCATQWGKKKDDNKGEVW
jgi:hypothetical protein